MEDKRTHKKKLAKRKAENTVNEKEISEEDSDMSVEDEINYTAPKKQMKDEEDWEEEEEITVEFEFYDPNPSQFFSIKSLINGYLDGLSYKSSDLAQLIIDQVEIGTMIGALEDEEESLIKNKPKDKNILGFATVMSVIQYQKEKVFQEIMNYIEDKSTKHNDRHEELLKIINEKNVGLLINERIINLSPKLIPILQSQLLQDINWAKNKSVNEKTNEFCDYDYILCVTKVFKDISNPASKKKKNNDINLKELIFPKFEDFAVLKKNPHFFMFPASTSKSNAGITNLESENNKEQCYRLIWLITMKEFDETFKGLEQYIE